MATSKIARKISKSNLPSYSLSATIDDSLGSAKLAGKAGAGQIVGLYNQTDDYWRPRVIKGQRINPLVDYFKSDTKEVMIEGTTNPDPRYPTRKMTQDKWLASYSPTYKKMLDKLNLLEGRLKAAVAKKNKELRWDCEAEMESIEKQIRAARSMFHRSLQSLYWLYVVRPAQVNLLGHNTIEVIMPNAENDPDQKAIEGKKNASQINGLGVEQLKKDGVITAIATPPSAPVTNIPVPVVDAMTAKTVMGQLTKLFNSEKFNPPVVATGKKADTTVDKEYQAGFALTCIGDIKPADLHKSAELKGIISKLAVDVLNLLKIKTIEEAEKGMGALRNAN
jgi:hypothetical protein